MLTSPSPAPRTTAGESGTELTWLGHATVAIDVGGVRVLTDPLLRRRTAGLARIGEPPARRHWSGADVVLLSHLHHDHADVASLRMLDRTPVATGAGNASWARRHGLPTRELPERGWRSMAPARAEGGEVEVHLVRADHGHRPMPHRPNEAHGFLVRSAGSVVWFAGDTSLHDEMSDLPEIAGREIDVALVPIGGWGPRLSGGHMGPVEAAEACRRVRARHVVPVHYGTLHPTFWPRSRRGWMSAPLARFATELSSASPRTRLHAPGIGGTVRPGH